MQSNPEQFFPRNPSHQKILRMIYDRGPVSRADIVRFSGLTAPTVSDITSNLLGEAIIEEVGLGPSTGGKRPTLLRLIDDAYHLIGLDLARGNFQGAVMNLRGEIRHRVSVPLNQHVGSPALSLVFDLVDRLVAATDRPLLGIGVGAPGLVDSANGIVVNAVNVEWRDIPLAGLLKERYHLPVYLSNDCQLAALAEYLYGSHSSDKPLVAINIGYGVGAGIVYQGKLLHGDFSGAGEIGHLVVEPAGELCQCGNRGCLETVIGSRAITRRAFQAGISRRPGTCMTQDANAIDEMEWLDVLEDLCSQGDEAIVQLVRETGHYLGIACASLVAVLGSCHILINGNLVCFGDLLLESAREALACRAFRPVVEQTDIGYATVENDIVMKGTSVLVLSRELWTLQA